MVNRSSDSNIGDENFIDEVFLEDNNPPAAPNAFTLISHAVDQFKKLLRSEIALTKAKFKKAAKKMAAGAVLLVVAGVFALYLLGWLLRSIEFAFALLVPQWAAALITSGILLVIVLILVSIGLASLKRGSDDIPDVGAQIQTDVDIIKEGLGK